jgi:glycerol-3-phosphate acyltransferase PlsX
MGSVYMEKVLGRENPAVALANIGAEAEKGTQLTKKAYELLSESGVNFTGNIEARDIPAGACDVIVADGFTGNIILKLTEGMFGQMVGLMKQKLPKEMLGALASRTDYSEYGGAPILGITRPVIKMHGSSGPKAVMNAVLKASEFAKQNVVGLIEAELK